jgi:hypothetical protein
MTIKPSQGCVIIGFITANAPDISKLLMSGAFVAKLLP